MSVLPTSRAEAKRLGVKRYWTGKPCKYGHTSERLTSTGTCKSCQQIDSRKRYHANPAVAREYKRRYNLKYPDRVRAARKLADAKWREYRREWNRAHKEQVNAKARARRAKNPASAKGAVKRYCQKYPERRLAQRKNWIEKNPQKHREYYLKRRDRDADNARKRAAKWRANNRRKHAANARARGRLVVRATPPWADDASLRLFYINCPAGYHVDHIIPLQGKTVCGLHILENLRYVPAIENLQKGNSFDASAWQYRDCVGFVHLENGAAQR